MDEPAWDHSTFSKNRDRLRDGEVAAKFLAAVLSRQKVKRLLSTQHFSADGILIEAWASLKSFKPKPGEAEAEGGPPEDGAGALAAERAGAMRRSTSIDRRQNQPAHLRRHPIVRPRRVRDEVQQRMVLRRHPRRLRHRRQRLNALALDRHQQ